MNESVSRWTETALTSGLRLLGILVGAAREFRHRVKAQFDHDGIRFNSAQRVEVLRDERGG